MKKIAIVSTVFLLAACARNPPDVLPPAPSTFSGATSVGSLSAREYLLPENIGAAFNDTKVKAFVVLDIDDDGRNMKVCQAFERLPEATLYQQIGMGSQIVPTYWPINRPVPDSLSGADKCRFMVDNYTWPIGSVVQRKADTPRPSTSYLVAMDGEREFYFDIDDGSQDKLDEVMSAWFATAASQPSTRGVTLTDWLTGPLQTLCREGWYDAVIQALPYGRTVNDVVGIAFRDGECEAALA